MSSSVVTAIRVVAVLIGLFIVGTSIADLMGLVPHSEDQPPPFGVRDVAMMAVGLVLLFPYRFLRHPWARALGWVGIAMTIAWVLLITVDAAVGFIEGRKSWHVVPFILISSAPVMANAIAFAIITRKR